MKRIFLSLVLSLLITAQAFAQEKHTTTYQVDYEVTYSLDSLHRENKTTEDFYLFSGPDFGVFTKQNVIKQEKRLEEARRKNAANTGDINYFSSSENPGLSKIFYKNLKSGEVKTLGKIDDKPFVYDQPKTSFNWQITDSTKTYHGHSVQKATTQFAGRNYVAWFALDIPLRDGPYLFSGLPGLIVELYDNRKDYVFTLKAINKLKEPRNWTVPNDTKTIAKKNYQKLKAKFMKNAYLSSNAYYMMHNTPGVFGSVYTDANGEVTKSNLKKNGKKISIKELRRLYKKNLENQNNPIELN